MQKLTNFITSNRQLPILDEIFITDKGLVYKDLTYVTNEQKQVEYIGAAAREQARQQKIAETQELIRKNQDEILILGQKVSYAKGKQKTVADVPKRTILDGLESENKILDKNILKLSNELGSIQSKLDTLNLTEPTHPVFRTYAYNDLYKIYTDFINKTAELSRIDNELKTTLHDMEDAQKELTEHTASIEEHDSTLSALHEQELRLQKEIAALEQDDYYSSLLEEKETLTKKLNQVKKEHQEVTKDSIVLRTEHKHEEDENNKIRKELESTRKTYAETNSSLGELLESLDTFVLEKSKKVNTEALKEFNLEASSERYSCSKIPTSKHSETLKLHIGNLRYPVVKNKEDNTVTTHIEQIELLEKDINTGFTAIQKMYESSQKNLSADIFPIIKRTHKNVLESIVRMKEHTEANKSSMLQFFIEYKLDDKHADKPYAIEDTQKQNELMTRINNRILDYINNSTELVETDAIVAMVLEELEPSKWYDISIDYINNNQPRATLTSKIVKEQFSTGERLRAYYTPLLTLIDIAKNQMKPDAPFIMIMDEAFDTLDETQTKYILNSINTISDLFIVTVPKGGLPMAEKTTRIDIVQLKKQELPSGGVITYALRNNLFEEIEND